MRVICCQTPEAVRRINRISGGLLIAVGIVIPLCVAPQNTRVFAKDGIRGGALKNHNLNHNLLCHLRDIHIEFR